jgi:hypothetical protein
VQPPNWSTLFASSTWRHDFKPLLKDLQTVINNGKVTLLRDLSWSRHVPLAVKLNIPTLGFLVHTSQLAFLSQLRMLQEKSEKAHCTYVDSAIAMTKRGQRRDLNDHKQFLEWGAIKTGFEDNCCLQGYENTDPEQGRRKFVLAYLARSMVLSTNMETHYYGTVLCKAFKFTTPGCDVVECYVILCWALMLSHIVWCCVCAVWCCVVRCGAVWCGVVLCGAV